MLQVYIIKCQPFLLEDTIVSQIKKKKKWIEIYDPSNLFVKGVKYDKWYELYKEKSKSQPEETISERLKGDDEVLSKIANTIRE